MHLLPARTASLNSFARSTWRPSVALPARRCCQQVQRRLACVASVPAAAADFAERVAPGGKVTKTAVSKLAVAQLRAECERLGLPADGLKAALVERLLGWWQQQAADQPAQQQVQQPEGRQQQVQQPEGRQQQSHPLQAASEQGAEPGAERAAAAPGVDGDGATQQGQRPRGSSVVQATWLGTSSGNPTPRRNVSSIAVRFDEDVFLVDCGEGTRNQLRRAELDPAAVRAVFVTHMHGDHCFGLGGVVSAVCEARLGSSRQGEPLLVYGPPEVQAQLLTAVRAGILQLTSPLLVVGLVLDPARARPPTPAGPSGLLRLALQAPDQAGRVPPALAASLQDAYDQGSERIVQPGLTWTLRVPGAPAVTAAQLQHRVPCWGYVFQEQPQPAAPPRSARGGAGPVPSDSSGEEEGGARGPPPASQRWVRPGRKLVVLGDTCDSSAIAPLALGCDMLSHEATFCTGMEDKAAVAQHSTTQQAGAFAAAVRARALVLTHFSARYDSLSGLTNRLKKRDERPRGEIRGEVFMADLQRSEMQRLRDETRAAYGKDSIYLASDFFTFTVHKRAPVPAEQLAEELAAQAAQAQEAVRAAQAAAQQGRRARRPQQRDREWQPRRQQGGGHRQWQQGGRPRQGQQPQQRRRQWAPEPSTY